MEIVNGLKDSIQRELNQNDVSNWLTLECH